MLEVKVELSDCRCRPCVSEERCVDCQFVKGRLFKRGAVKGNHLVAESEVMQERATRGVSSRHALTMHQRFVILWNGDPNHCACEQRLVDR